MIPIYTKPLACMSSLSLCALVVLLCPDIVLGADNPNTFTPLVGIPGLTDNVSNKTLPEYINAVYMLTITIGALFGVVKIAFAGVKYSMSGVVTDKSAAKKDILNVLGGLAVLLLPFVVLNTINPELIRLDVLHGAPKIELGKFPSSGGDSGSTPVSTDKSPFASSYPAGTAITSCAGTVTYPNRTVGPGGIGGDDGDVVIDMSACRNTCTERSGKFIQQGESGSSCVYDAKTFESGGKYSNQKCMDGEVLTNGPLGTYYCEKIPGN